MVKTKTAVIDSVEVVIEDERNLLELVRKAHIELPTFCYHSDISVYGACRMCMVEVEGRGLVPACSTPASDGMVVHTNTKQIRDMRKMIVELLLANHDLNCTTCPKSGDCQLQKIARQLGVTKVRFKQTQTFPKMDHSSDAILRDPKKCVLCGDCVRVCREIQTVGVLDFAGRGAGAIVTPSFNKGIGEVECVGCGQCVKVCPVGALTPKYQAAGVWDAIYDKTKTVVVQIAPAVRVALGEEFGFKTGTTVTGQIVAALKMMALTAYMIRALPPTSPSLKKATNSLPALKKANVCRSSLPAVRHGSNLPSSITLTCSRTCPPAAHRSRCSAHCAKIN